MEFFLKNFIKESLALYKDGLDFKDDNKIVHNVKVICLCTCLDSKAKPLVQKTKQFNGYNGCCYCKHEGVQVEVGNNNNNNIRYVNLNQDIEMRNNNELRQKMKDKEYGEAVTGVTPFIALPYFDICYGFIIDYLHNLCLGVIKRTTNLWTDSGSHEKEYYIGRFVTEINSRLNQLQPPKVLGRMPRGIIDRIYWKATEWRNWALYYSMIVLKGILEEKYLSHFALLVNSMAILLSNNISEEKLLEAEESLKTFVNNYEDLYGEINMVYNVHLLTHVCEMVRRYGPLWGYSAFVFESTNGHLTKLVNGTVGTANQITKKFITSLKIQKAFISERCTEISPEVKNFCQKVMNFPLTKAFTKVDGVYVSSSNKYIHHPSEIEKKAIEIALGECPNEIIGYLKFLKEGVKYHSSNYKKTKRTNDSFVKVDGDFARIDGIYCIFDRIFIVLKRLKIVFDGMPISEDSSVSHIKPCIIDDKANLLVVPVRNMKKIKKCILLNVNNLNYVMEPVNDIEINSQ